MSTLDREVAREFGVKLASMFLLNPKDIDNSVLESIGIRAFRRALELAEQTDFGERGES